MSKQDVEMILTILKDIAKSMNIEGYVDEVKANVQTVMKYISQSGNVTWKCRTDIGREIYLRQSQMDMLVECGLYEHIEPLPFDEQHEANFNVYAIPDGNFLKILRIEVPPEPVGDAFDY